MTHPDWLSLLNDIPRLMAAEVSDFLPRATRAGYARFLHTMYHYTLGSEARLRTAAQAATDASLRAFLFDLAEDESQHHRLAEADLAALGHSPAMDPPDAVRAFASTWSGLGSDHAAAWLGALVVLEGVAGHLGKIAQQTLGRLGIGRSEARFVLVHLQADEAHGAACRQHALRLGDLHSVRLLQGARAAAAAWVDMHRCLVS
jgi:hypothetical protein